MTAKREQKQAAMQRWEYHLEYIEDYSPVGASIHLNKLGQKGWELVGIRWHEHDTLRYIPMAFFKRPLEETPAPDAPTCGVTDCAQGFGMPCEVCAPDMDTKGEDHARSRRND